MYKVVNGTDGRFQELSSELYAKGFRLVPGTWSLTGSYPNCAYHGLFELCVEKPENVSVKDKKGKSACINEKRKNEVAKALNDENYKSLDEYVRAYNKLQTYDPYFVAKAFQELRNKNYRETAASVIVATRNIDAPNGFKKAVMNHISTMSGLNDWISRALGDYGDVGFQPMGSDIESFGNLLQIIRKFREGK